jgi:hypothetical protein
MKTCAQSSTVPFFLDPQRFLSAYGSITAIHGDTRGFEGRKQEQLLQSTPLFDFLDDEGDKEDTVLINRAPKQVFHDDLGDLVLRKGTGKSRSPNLAQLPTSRV